MKTFNTWLESRLMPPLVGGYGELNLNKLASKMVNSIRTGGLTIDKAAEYVQTKTTSEKDFNKVMEMIQKEFES